MSTGLAQSVQTRLVRHAKALGADPSTAFPAERTRDALATFAKEAVCGFSAM